MILIGRGLDYKQRPIHRNRQENLDISSEVVRLSRWASGGAEVSRKARADPKQAEAPSTQQNTWRRDGSAGEVARPTERRPAASGKSGDDRGQGTRLSNTLRATAGRNQGDGRDGSVKAT